MTQKQWSADEQGAARRMRSALLAAAAACLACAAQASVVYTYSGRNLIYSPAPPGQPPFTTYGTHVVAQLSFDDALLGAGFTGTLEPSQFNVLIGTDTYALQTAGTWRLPTTGAILPAFVRLVQGTIVDWSFGSLYSVLGNQVTIGSTGQGETILPFPRVVLWGTAGSGGAGTWTLQSVSAVPLPAAAYLFVAGLATLGLALGRRRAPGAV